MERGLAERSPPTPRGAPLERDGEWRTESGSGRKQVQFSLGLGLIVGLMGLIVGLIVAFWTARQVESACGLPLGCREEHRSAVAAGGSCAEASTLVQWRRAAAAVLVAWPLLSRVTCDIKLPAAHGALDEGLQLQREAGRESGAAGRGQTMSVSHERQLQDIDKNAKLLPHCILCGRRTCVRLAHGLMTRHEQAIRGTK